MAPGGGATHLLYHLCARAVLPANLSGKQACAVIIDTDGTFSVPRLAAQIQRFADQRLASDTSDTTAEEISTTADETLLTALKHVHIFRPQSLAGTIATIDALPSYLFDSKKHSSFDRIVGFIAIDSTSAFYWQDRAETEDAAFLASTSGTGTKPPPAQIPAYTQLSTSLKKTCSTFQCPAVITTHHFGLIPQTSSHTQPSFRPALSAPLSNMPNLRLAVWRLPVRKFPPAISAEDALREAGDRQRAVETGKFKCVVNAWDTDERTLQRLERLGDGFDFKITTAGVVVVDDA